MAEVTSGSLGGVTIIESSYEARTRGVWLVICHGTSGGVVETILGFFNIPVVVHGAQIYPGS